MTIRISDSLTLPAEAVTETFAVLGKRGSGKTNTAVVLVEELVAAKLPVCVVDPVGVWWGLRAGADGDKRGGLPITIIGGEHGDVPLEETAGRELAAFVVQEHAQVVLDLSLLRKGAQTRFMTDFAEEVYRLKAIARDPLHIVVDEADAYAPQRTGPEGARLLGAMEDLIRRGRSRGIGMTLITQRPAVLNKNVLTQAEVLVVLKLTAPQDHAAIDEWVRANADETQRKKVASSLASLPVGTAWFWSPGWLNVFERVKVRARRTFDSSATPKPGQRAVTPRELAHVDLDALKKRIAATVEKVKSDDPKVLRARIAELERQLREPKTIHVPAPYIPEALMRAVAEAITAMDVRRRELVEALAHAEAEGARVAERPKANGITLPAVAIPSVSLGDAPMPRRSTFDAKRAAETEAAAGLSIGDRKILTVLARHPAGRSKIQVAILTGYAHNGGGFSNYLSSLRTRGLLEGGGDCLKITDAGRVALGTLEPLPVGRELLEYWKRHQALGKAERLILDELARVSPSALPKAALANRTGYESSGGGFNNALSRLRTLELVKGSRDISITPTLVGG